CTGYLWLRFFALKKKSIEQEVHPPTASPVLWLFSLLFFAQLLLTGLKMYDNQFLRGSVLVDVAKVYAAPGDSEAVLMELNVGLEVNILDVQHPGWLQVSYPGTLTGWVKKTDVHILGTR
ncbi:MAG: SH3 domain-containing protein, partial [Pseudobdellovibrionaceae bacterium]